MTDRVSYQDVFKTINIPEKERRIALTAKDLIDGAHSIDGWRPEVHQHLSKLVDTPEVTQAFWNYENDEEGLYDRLVITMIGRGLTVAREHRQFDTPRIATRSTLHIGNGTSSVYFSDFRNRGHIGDPETSKQALDIFRRQFSDTIANLGLYHRIHALRQSESDAAILANAA